MKKPNVPVFVQVISQLFLLLICYSAAGMLTFAIPLALVMWAALAGEIAPEQAKSYVLATLMLGGGSLICLGYLMRRRLEKWK